jgi:hypothetical protein
MDINAKIKLIAETMTGYSVVVDTSNGANVELSKITMPCILVFIQETGEFASNNSHYRDSVNIRVAFLNKMPKGFKESDVETMRYELKQDMVILYHKLKFDFQFKINNETVRYEIVYDEFDDNLIGVVFNDNIKERVGLNLACDVPDSHGELPSSPSFCQKVSECSSIVSINEMLDSLQQQIDNLPTTTGVQSVTGPQVDNTDPFNPIVNPLGLIKIVDLNGDFFTDLATAIIWIEQFFSDPTIITDKSFNDNIFFFTVPCFTVMDQADGFLNNSTASFIDSFGLITEFQGGSVFYQNNAKHIFKDIFFNVVEAFTDSELDCECNDFSMDSNTAFASNTTGTFKIKRNIDPTAASSGFFYSSTATILASAKLYTSNAGLIDSSLEQAIANGCNVQFEGINSSGIKGGDIPSATTTNLIDYIGDYHHITGTTTIASFGMAPAGYKNFLVFDGVLILTNSANIILPNSLNIQTAANDIAELVSEGGGVWRLMRYQRYSDTWTTYSPTLTGFSVKPTGFTARYILNGKTCMISFNSTGSGTSNATSITMTLPFVAASIDMSAFPYALDNGTVCTAGGITTAGSNVINILKNGAASWTSSGSKRVFGIIIYQIQ